MALRRFQYLQCNSLDEAFSLLLKYKDEAKVIASGTDIITGIQQKKITPKYLIGLQNIPHLDYIEHDAAQGLRIGTAATLASIADTAVVKTNFNILAQAIDQMASPQIRNKATIGGNLCNASPSADTAPPLLAMEAKVLLVSSSGNRLVFLDSFFTGPSQTVLKEGELLLEVQIPNLPGNSFGVYLKQSLRKSMSLSTVSVAVIFITDRESNRCQDVRIALGAVAPVPMRARRAEMELRNKYLDKGLIDIVARTALEEACPISDIRSTAEYRKRMIQLLVTEALGQIGAKIQENQTK